MPVLWYPCAYVISIWHLTPQGIKWLSRTYNKDVWGHSRLFCSVMVINHTSISDLCQVVNSIRCVVCSVMRSNLRESRSNTVCVSSYGHFSLQTVQYGKTENSIQMSGSKFCSTWDSIKKTFKYQKAHIKESFRWWRLPRIFCLQLDLNEEFVNLLLSSITVPVHK